MTETIDTVVVGGGIVGVAVARALARRGAEVVVVEAERALGQHQSSRNSEVIHAGLYYPPGSRRARWCVAGREALYEYCRARGVDHRRVGKLVVATTPTQAPTLEEIAARARANGVDDVAIVDAAEVRRREPAVVACAALVSPSTGIVDSHGLLSALWADATDAGAQVALATRVLHIRYRPGEIVVHTEDAAVRCRRLVVAAGIDAPTVAAAIDAYPRPLLPRRRLLKGSYFRIDARPFAGLVYPVPATASLGIHVTVDLAGGVRFGPDQQWVDELDYRVDPARAVAFAEAIRRYWPEVDASALRPDYAGIRAKIHGPGEPQPDFALHGPAEHGLAGVVALFGIESPGLTACLPLADAVAAAIGR